MIPEAKISSNLTYDLNVFSDKKVLFVTDKKIWQNCVRFFPKNFLERNLHNLILDNPKADEKNLQKIAQSLQGCDFILALGSGTINDLCKYISAQKNIPYAVIASALSMNGYLSRNASITISGHKKTLPATLPTQVLCDLRILKSAPVRLTRAGIGDSLCFYSCWFDWYLSHKIYNTKFDIEPFMLLHDKMQILCKNYHKFSLQDDEFIKLLGEILLLSGQGMTKAGGSYPASQSEHMIAHTIEMKYPKIAAKKLHGEIIAVTTLTASQLQQKILERDYFENAQFEKMSDFFGKKIDAQCRAEYSEKKALKAGKFDWPKFKKELQKIHLNDATLKEILRHFKIKFSAKSLGISNQQYQSCVSHAKFTRNRFTVLDLVD